MAYRSPARWLAPLALVAFLVALFVVIGASGGDGGDGTAGETPAATEGGTTTTSGEEGSDRERTRRRKTYVVKLGDTPSAIAAETGVPLEEIERLNPDLDPQLLTPGDRIRLRR